jgi:hypothetical protein
MARKKPKRRLSKVTQILKTAVAIQARNLKKMCRLCGSRHNPRVGEAMSRPVVKKKQSKRKRKMSEATAACGGGANQELIGKTEKVSRRQHRWAQRKEKPMEEKDVVYVTFTEEDLQEAWRLAERRRAYAKNVTAHEVDYNVDDDGLAHILEDSISEFIGCWCMIYIEGQTCRRDAAVLDWAPARAMTAALLVSPERLRRVIEDFQKRHKYGEDVLFDPVVALISEKLLDAAGAINNGDGWTVPEDVIEKLREDAHPTVRH